eukprot:TRINITY_DN7654_c0_g1_i2.p1 TRINITY_DN7654_c0_g1~~TRINITY_DN7654_c0_g1_i2.p1  ORF type:complete len:502 (-),score=96.87 TRINITY_DN7654_c0_g1_i2:166-1671(-)
MFSHPADDSTASCNDSCDLPMIFRLTRTISLGAFSEANRDTISFRQLIQGDIQEAILSSYLVDIPWMMTREAPKLASVAKVVILHGDEDLTKNAASLKTQFPNLTFFAPHLPVMYGTHHSKFAILFYPTGVRVAIFSANLLVQDWYHKTQSLWVQDFPLKTTDSPRTCAFEDDLVLYLASLRASTVDHKRLARYDFSRANVSLVASIPGTHRTDMHRWGHMKLRALLSTRKTPREQDLEYSFQSSSLGSMDKKWLGQEWMESLNPVGKKASTPFTLAKSPKPARWFVFPTVEQVRNSIEGYASGGSIPVRVDVVQKLLQSFDTNDCLCRWDGGDGVLGRSGGAVERERAMPHIKTLVCHRGAQIVWAYTGSHNLSKAAWGSLQKEASQFFIRSYELGILAHQDDYADGIELQEFSCTPHRPITTFARKNRTEKQRVMMQSTAVDVDIGAATSAASSSQILRVFLPVPYALPPHPYQDDDVPWSVDLQQSKPDHLGKTWPLQ